MSSITHNSVFHLTRHFHEIYESDEIISTLTIQNHRIYIIIYQNWFNEYNHKRLANSNTRHAHSTTRFNSKYRIEICNRKTMDGNERNDLTLETLLRVYRFQQSRENVWTSSTRVLFPRERSQRDQTSVRSLVELQKDRHFRRRAANSIKKRCKKKLGPRLNRM